MRLGGSTSSRGGLQLHGRSRTRARGNPFRRKRSFIDATDELHRAEKLLILEEPDLNITNRGRPAEGKNMTKEARTNYLTNHITNYLTNYLTIRPN